MTAWPFVPNWSGGVKEQFAFLTSIVTSRSGREQRSATRSTPRHTLEFDILLAGEDRRKFDRLMTSSQDSLVTMPHWTWGARLATALASGGTAFTVNSVLPWLVNGVSAALVEGSFTAEVTVNTVSGTTVTLSAAASRTWSTRARLCPRLSGYLETDFDVTAQTSNVITASVLFSTDPTTGAYDEGAPELPGLFLDREIFLHKPNWANPVSSKYVHPTEAVDYDRGRVVRFSPIDFSTRSRAGTYLRRTFDQAHSLRKFFFRMRGRRGEFYHPSFEPDLIPSADLTVGDTTITFTGREVYDTYATDTVHGAIYVVLQSGVTIPRSVVSVTLVSGNSVLTLGQTWPSTYSAGQVRHVCWMPVSRFASDTLTLEWLTSEVAQVQISTTSLEAFAAETDLNAIYPDSTLWLLDNYGWDFVERVMYDPIDYAVNVRYPDIVT